MVILAGAMMDGPDEPLWEERRCHLCNAWKVAKVVNEVSETWMCPCCDQSPTNCPHVGAQG